MKRGKKRNLQEFQELQESTVQTQLTERSSRRSVIDQLKRRKKEEENKKPTGPIWPVYKKFFGYTMKRWKSGIGCLLLSVISGAITSIFPWQLGILLDVITKQTNENSNPEQFHDTLIRHMIQLGAITLAMGVFTFFRYITLQLFQESISIDLKTDIFSIFIKNDVNFFEMYKSGELISRLSNDINQAKSAISNNLTFLIRNIVNIMGTMIVLFIMSWRLTFIVLTIVPVYAFVTLQYTRKAKKLVKQKQDIEAEISVHIGEKFGGIHIIKSFCSEEQEIKKYAEYNQASYDVTKQRTMYQGIQMTCSQVLPSFGSMLVLLYAGIRLLSGEVQLSAGQLTSFILYCSNLANTTSGISNSYTNIVNGASAIQKVFEMLNYERLIDEDSGRSIEIDGNIRFQDVEFKYPRAENNIFNGINFEVKAGEFVAFVGQSGSGKSTITKLLEHFYKINGGRIIFSQQDTSQLNIKSIRQQIGLVNQEATIFSGTIQENITYGMADYSVEELEIAAKKSGCLEFISNRVMFPDGFQTMVGERGLNLSGGQKQRISIARALMRKPKVLIFDQATSALDSHSEAMVQRSIQELAENHSITIIVVAHRLSTVIHCDRLYVMKEGMILESGSHQELLQKHGYYYELIQKQLQGKFQDSPTSVKSRRSTSSVNLSQKANQQHSKNNSMVLEHKFQHSLSAPKELKA